MTGSLADHLVLGSHTAAELRAAGVGRREREGPLWTQWQHGRWVWGADPEELPGPRERVFRAAGLLLEEGAIGGWAAALMHGADVDGLRYDSTTKTLVAAPVLLCLPRVVRSLRKRDVLVWRSDLTPSDVVVVDGIRVTSPLRTAFDLARRGPTLDDALPPVDQLMKASGVTPADLALYVRRHPRFRGVPRARTVADLADPRVRSAAESRMRVLWCVDAGLPRPLVNRVLLDQFGRPMAEVDLFDEESGLVGEYDGAVHSGAEKRANDEARAERLRGANLRVVRLTSSDLASQRRRAVVRVQSERRLGLARVRARDQWRVAPAEWKDSARGTPWG